MRLPSNRFAQDCRAPYLSQCRDAGGDAVLGELTAVVLSRRTHVEDVEHRQPNLTARSVAGN
jgi:hypothetical protein